jgi:hypothetical protein
MFSSYENHLSKDFCDRKILTNFMKYLTFKRGFCMATKVFYFITVYENEAGKINLRIFYQRSKYFWEDIRN